MYDFYVILGCFGLRVDDFINCSGVENIILKVNVSLPYYNEMMDYFDQCRLFDKPMFDINAIRHIIFNMQDRYDQVVKPLWSIKKFELYQKFVIEHRHCGLYLKLNIPESNSDSTIDKNVELGEKQKYLDDIIPNKLRLVRGKR